MPNSLKCRLKKLANKGLLSEKDLNRITIMRDGAKWKMISPAKIYECSSCGRNVMTDDIDVYYYCMGCGARMKGE